MILRPLNACKECASPQRRWWFGTRFKKYEGLPTSRQGAPINFPRAVGVAPFLRIRITIFKCSLTRLQCSDSMMLAHSSVWPF
jgi:hypothetical protein